jgi:hypothetical protein
MGIKSKDRERMKKDLIRKFQDLSTPIPRGGGNQEINLQDQKAGQDRQPENIQQFE